MTTYLLHEGGLALIRRRPGHPMELLVVGGDWAPDVDLYRELVSDGLAEFDPVDAAEARRAEQRIRERRRAPRP